MVIVKHNNPCGVGVGDDLATAYERALTCDPLSAFGSVIAVNRPADRSLAAAMADLFVEVVVAPDYRRGSAPPLRRQETAAADPLPAIPGGRRARSSCARSTAVSWPRAPTPLWTTTPAAWTCATERQPSDEEREALELAWKVVRGGEVERHRGGALRPHRGHRLPGR